MKAVDVSLIEMQGAGSASELEISSVRVRLGGMNTAWHTNQEERDEATDAIQPVDIEQVRPVSVSIGGNEAEPAADAEQGGLDERMADNLDPGIADYIKKLVYQGWGVAPDRIIIQAEPSG